MCPLHVLSSKRLVAKFLCCSNINTCTDMLTCRLSNSRQLRWRLSFSAVNDLAQDEVHNSVCSVCSSCLTLLACPDSYGGGLGRDRVFSRRLVLFSFFRQYLFRSLQSIRMHMGAWIRHWSYKVAFTPWACQVGGSIPECSFFFVCRFFWTAFLFGAVWFHNRVPLVPDVL